MGISNLTKEYIGICHYLKIPFIIVVSKIDICPANILKETYNNIKIIFKKALPDKKFYFINDEKDIDMFQKFKISNTVIPIFSISNKTGHNINLFKNFLLNLSPNNDIVNTNQTKFYIDAVYNVKGIGIVLSGTIRSGSIKVNDILYLGPYYGRFVQVKVKSLHNNIREEIKELKDIGCVAIAFRKEVIPRKTMKKGMILLNEQPKIHIRFKAKIKILHHGSTIKTGYQPVIHCKTIRQSATLILDKDKILRSGSHEIVEFEYCYRKEYMEIGQMFFLRENKVKAYGIVLELL